MNKLDFSAEIINNKLAHSGQTEWTLLQDFTLEEDLTTDMILSPPSMKEYSEYIFGAAFNTIEPTNRNNLILFANGFYSNAHRLLDGGSANCVPNCQGHVWLFKCSKILGVTGKDALEFCGFMRQMPKKVGSNNNYPYNPFAYTFSHCNEYKSFYNIFQPYVGEDSSIVALPLPPWNRLCIGLVSQNPIEAGGRFILYGGKKI